MSARAFSAAALAVGVGIGLLASPYVRDQASKFEYSERGNGISFSNSMACKGVAESYVAALPFKKEVTAMSGPGQDQMAVKVSTSGLAILTQAAVSIGTTEASPMPIVKEDDSIVFAAEISHAPSVDVMIIDKKSGNAIWSRTNLIGGVLGPAGQVEYMECR